MLVVDAQIHVWGPETPDRPWMPGGADVAHLPEPLDAEKLIPEMDRVGVDRALLVSPTWEGERDRNDVVLDTVEAYPDRFGGIVRLPLDDPGYADQLERWADDPRVLGARTMFIRRAKDWLTDGTADWFWPVAAKLGMPVMVYAPLQYEAVAAVAQRHPDLRLTVCHFGIDVHLRDDQALPHVDGLLGLAQYDNVAVKATSLPSYVNEPHPFPSLHEPIERVVDAFGPRRVFWGSDLSRLSCDYAELFSLFMEELDFLGDEDRELIMGRAVCEWFGWPTETTGHR